MNVSDCTLYSCRLQLHNIALCADSAGFGVVACTH